MTARVSGPGPGRHHVSMTDFLANYVVPAGTGLAGDPDRVGLPAIRLGRRRRCRTGTRRRSWHGGVRRSRGRSWLPRVMRFINPSTTGAVRASAYACCLPLIWNRAEWETASLPGVPPSGATASAQTQDELRCSNDPRDRTCPARMEDSLRAEGSLGCAARVTCPGKLPGRGGNPALVVSAPAPAASPLRALERILSPQILVGRAGVVGDAKEPADL